MKPSLTMFNNSDTFENFFLFGCYINFQNFFIHGQQQQLHHPPKTFSFMVINNFRKLFHSWSSTTTSSSTKNFFIHGHQQQLHDHHQQTFSFMIIINKLFHPPKTFSFMVNNNNFRKLFHSWSTTTTS